MPTASKIPDNDPIMKAWRKFTDSLGIRPMWDDHDAWEGFLAGWEGARKDMADRIDQTAAPLNATVMRTDAHVRGDIDDLQRDVIEVKRVLSKHDLRMDAINNRIPPDANRAVRYAEQAHHFQGMIAGFNAALHLGLRSVVGNLTLGIWTEKGERIAVTQRDELLDIGALSSWVTGTLRAWQPDESLPPGDYSTPPPGESDPPYCGKTVYTGGIPSGRCDLAPGHEGRCRNRWRTRWA